MASIRSGRHPGVAQRLNPVVLADRLEPNVRVGPDLFEGSWSFFTRPLNAAGLATSIVVVAIGIRRTARAATSTAEATTRTAQRPASLAVAPCDADATTVRRGPPRPPGRARPEAASDKCKTCAAYSAIFVPGQMTSRIADPEGTDDPAVRRHTDAWSRLPCNAR
ncbi:hypothetical protein [Jiangella mangrovi]|uniref:Uncharacterized protein n=1 Tax=Jiangella mangrovi TaxID=1524084 RepID=A0A7W9GVG1_9ACTN|nr:hypothetical protein [Jiangella mangrovi]MBB5790401.1 hypothetical protein [Jiangella mangrovi]